MTVYAVVSASSFILTYGYSTDIIRKNKPFIVVVGDVKAKRYDLPEHGGQTVVMHQGKIKRVKSEDGDEW